MVVESSESIKSATTFAVTIFLTVKEVSLVSVGELGNVTTKVLASVIEPMVWLLLYTVLSVADSEPVITILSPAPNPWAGCVNVAVAEDTEIFAVAKSPIPIGLLSALL